MYSEKVMDHFANPRNVGEIENADGVGEVGNPKCGDIMKMFLKIDGNTITDVKFKTFGCGAAIATVSYTHLRSVVSSPFNKSSRNASLYHAIRPVSYTHLDVYKRQVLNILSQSA